MTGIPTLRGRKARFTRLDGCGDPVLGPDSQLVTKGFITIGLTAVTQDPTAITVELADGSLCINDTPPTEFQGFTVTITLCGVDPEVVNLTTGNPLRYDDAEPPNVIGFTVKSKINLRLLGFAIELWSDIAGDACDESGNVEYGYFALPFLKGGVMGDLTIENGAVNAIINNATSKDGTRWGVGPYDITLDDAGDESPLFEALESDDHFIFQTVKLAPPEDSDGFAALGVQATGATQGAPATLTPANSYAPLDLADAIALPLTASPGTAWTAGNYVLTRSGVKIKWNGTNWVNF